MKVFDVGCGSTPYETATHTCDVYLRTPEEIQDGILLKVDTSRNFILCSVEALPYKDGSFEVVHCGHVIEHADNPFKAIRELERVANKTLIIRVPYLLCKSYKAPYHKHYFTKGFFRERGFKASRGFRFHYDHRFRFAETKIFKFYKKIASAVAIDEIVAVKHF